MLVKKAILTEDKGRVTKIMTAYVAVRYMDERITKINMEEIAKDAVDEYRAVADSRKQEKKEKKEKKRRRETHGAE